LHAGAAADNLDPVMANPAGVRPLFFTSATAISSSKGWLAIGWLKSAENPTSLIDLHRKGWEF
jgi:hypothetical protein